MACSVSPESFGMDTVPVALTVDSSTGSKRKNFIGVEQYLSVLVHVTFKALKAFL